MEYFFDQTHVGGVSWSMIIYDPDKITDSGTDVKHFLGNTIELAPLAFESFRT